MCNLRYMWVSHLTMCVVWSLHVLVWADKWLHVPSRDDNFMCKNAARRSVFAIWQTERLPCPRINTASLSVILWNNINTIVLVISFWQSFRNCPPLLRSKPHYQYMPSVLWGFPFTYIPFVCAQIDVPLRQLKRNSHAWHLKSLL